MKMAEAKKVSGLPILPLVLLIAIYGPPTLYMMATKTLQTGGVAWLWDNVAMTVVGWGLFMTISGLWLITRIRLARRMVALNLEK
jgi:hypothetical protein